MPRKSQQPMKPVTVRLTARQHELVARLVRQGGYGNSEPEIIRFFLVKELERLFQGEWTKPE
jgi:Arc/MetJ-type ribon-helix-helix transcriptional regulator